MKRSLLIALGILLVLILVAIWVYVLMTGSTENTERFNDLGFGNTTDPTYNPAPAPAAAVEPTVTTNTAALRQLTTKPVAGYADITATSSQPTVQYVEAGTGHLYTINLASGEERRVSATTIPVATKAVITPNGAHVMIQAGERADGEFIIGSIATSGDKLSNFALREPVSAFTATTDNELLYAVPGTSNTEVKAYTPRTNRTRTLFTIPFRDVSIAWHTSTAGPHLVYPRAASRLKGYVYSYYNGAMKRLPIAGYGTAAIGSDTAALYSEITTTGDYVSHGVDLSSGRTTKLPLTVIPEKCVARPGGYQLLCGVAATEYSDRMPDTWYRGSVTLADSLWEVSPAGGSMTLLAKMSDNAGRSIDLVTPRLSADQQRLYFANKTDNTLWLYDFSKN